MDALILLLIALAAVGWFAFLQSRKRTVVAPTEGPTALDRVGMRGAALPPPEPAGLAVLRERVDQLSDEVEALKRRLPPPEVQAPVVTLPSPRPAPPLPEPEPPESFADLASDAFVEWCQTRGPMVNRTPLFERALSTEVPGAQVTAMERDPSAVSPPRFLADGASASGDYWLLQRDGEVLLFPGPQSRSQFRDPSGVFDGVAQPQNVQTVVPARVREDGIGAYVLVERGEISEKVAHPPRTSEPAAEDTGAAPPPIRKPDPSPVEAEDAPAVPSSEQVAQAFVEWCRVGGPFINRGDMFERKQLGQSVPGALLTIVYRDLDSGALQLTFRPNRDGVISPAEYWLVSVGSDHFVLPQPLSQSTFRDTNGVYNGAASPAAVQHLLPARVDETDGGYLLQQTGSLT